MKNQGHLSGPGDTRTVAGNMWTRPTINKHETDNRANSAAEKVHNSGVLMQCTGLRSSASIQGSNCSLKIQNPEREEKLNVQVPPAKFQYGYTIRIPGLFEVQRNHTPVLICALNLKFVFFFKHFTWFCLVGSTSTHLRSFRLRSRQSNMFGASVCTP